MVTGLIGKKVGMTQVFAADGSVQPATVLKAGPCVVSQVKTMEHDGYEAVQLGYVDARPTKENKPTVGHFKKAGVPPTRIRREVRVKAGSEPLKLGDNVNVSIFADGERVDVIGTSRGKGFQTAHLIYRHAQASRRAPLHKQVTPCLVLVRQRHAADTAFGRGSNLRHPQQALPQSFAVYA
jgi:large subunit ribosomal protein L3